MFRIQFAVTLLIVVGSSFSILSGSDRYFPFSSYPMYSQTFETPEIYSFRWVRAVNADGTEDRLRVQDRLKPFWLASFRMALLADPSAGAIESKLAATLVWYNRNSKLESNQNQISGLRLYVARIPWVEIESAANSGEPIGNTLLRHRRLLVEVRR